MTAGALAPEDLGQALQLCRIHVAALVNKGFLQEATSSGTQYVVQLAQVSPVMELRT